MILPILVAVTKPWTYWIAPPVLAAAVLLIAGLAATYYGKVVVPSYQLSLRRQEHRVAQLVRPPASARPSRMTGERPRAQAA